MPREQRRLAAIISADVAGYSRLMGRDESGTLARLREHRKQRFEPIVERFGGRIVKLTGDGALVEFASAVDALGAAITFQQAVADANHDQPQDSAVVFRIGLHLGDLIVEDDDLYGDGVNVAARLEAEADPGGIVISGAVRELVSGRVKASFGNLGERVLKNIERAVPAYSVAWTAGDWPNTTAEPRAQLQSAAPSSAQQLPLPDKPSIAVLPFQNMSGDPEQEYFADGMVEDIITALSRFRSLFVIARNSSFAYKGRAVDAKQIGRELGVRYLLEDSVRKAANRVRITGQLIDATTGAHHWANRFDGGLDDIFDLQDQVTESIVGAIAPAVEEAEIERAKRNQTENFDAYDQYLRGLSSHYRAKTDRHANEEALRLFNKVINLDPSFASAYGRAALCYCWSKTSGWGAITPIEIAEVRKLARRAIEQGKDDVIALAASGYALAYVARDLSGGAALIDRALAFNSNWAEAWFWGGWVKIWLGEPEAAIERFARAIRLNPLDPSIGGVRAGVSHAHFFLGHYDEAASWAAMTLQDNPDFQPGLRIEAASNAMAGRVEEGYQALLRLRELNPALRVSNLKDVSFGPYRRAEDIARYEEGLRRAGLPE